MSSSLTISTNVGTLSYAGGADTNVLYFTGEVSSAVSLNSGTALKVNSISNIGGIGCIDPSVSGLYLYESCNHGCVGEGWQHDSTLTDSYGNVISKTIEVRKIDRKKPTVTLRSGNSTGADTVYNELTIAVLPEDTGGSGVAKVEYAWTNTTGTPSAWKTLTAAADGSYQAQYTAAETSKTVKHLHVRVTDGAGNVSETVKSGSYQVIKKAVGAAPPSITVTGNPASWTKSATLTWKAAPVREHLCLATRRRVS